MNAYSQIKKPTTEDTNSNSDKNSSLSGENKENKSKFSFIKKKVNHDEKKLEIENLLQTENKIEVVNEIFGNLNLVQVSNEEKQVTQTNSSKFSFIKSKAGAMVNPVCAGVGEEKGKDLLLRFSA
jgi:hypothetical protein